MAGTARCRTVRSMMYMRHASASTAKPTQSRVVARAAGVEGTVVGVMDLRGRALGCGGQGPTFMRPRAAARSIGRRCRP